MRTEPELTRVVKAPQISLEQQTAALCATTRHVLANDWSIDEIRDLLEALGFIKVTS
jgi:hypothetical protein